MGSFLFLLLLAGSISTLAIYSDSAVDGELRPAITCAEEGTASLRVILMEECPSPLISLGASALSESVTASGEVDSLHPTLAARFEIARVAAALEGVKLYITSGFRSQERQAILFRAAIEKYGSESEAAKWVLPAQSSHHPMGLAIDINYPKDRAGASWLEANGARFGLCRVYANEWWHFEPVIGPGEICPVMAESALVDLR